MGLFKKIFRPVRKIAKKIIPKEVKPFLPYLAAAYFGPKAAKFASTGIFSNPGVTKALIAGTTSAATDEKGDPLRAAALAGAPDFLQQGLGKAGQFLNVPTVAPDAVQGASITGDISGLLTKAADSDLLNLATDPFGQSQGLGQLMDVGKVVGTQAAIDQTAKFKEINQDEIDKYNEELRRQGVLDKTKRRSAIFNIYSGAGYDSSYINSMLDRYGYESGGIAYLADGGMEMSDEILENFSRGYKDSKDAMKALFTRKKRKKEPEMTISEKGDVVVNFPDRDDDDDAFEKSLDTALRGLEKLQKPGVQPTPMMKFARGGEVEEEVEESGIMMASAPGPKDNYDDMAMDLFGKPYKDLTPDEMQMMQEELERLMNKFRSSADDEGIMQMASGYKTDMEEMYEQYVFEMEEQGLEPMSFAQFLAQARAGMARGGRMRGPDWFQNRVEELMDQGYSYEEAGEIAYNEGVGGRYKDGGQVSINQIEMLIKRGADNDLIKTYVEGAQDGVIDQIRESMKKRKNKKDGGEVHDDNVDDLGPGKNMLREDHIDKMPKPKKMDGIMQAADGGIMEKDMRGGGFIPEGSKERADDVPARLSKNEFVMTADAVRAAGGGSVNKGAKRMYDMMYSLEGKI